MNIKIHNENSRSKYSQFKTDVSSIDPSEDIAYAGVDEEFFWEDSDVAVTEGIAVGVHTYLCEDNFCKQTYSSDLVLFKNIYWSDKNLQ
jgi:hypothetical protein